MGKVIAEIHVMPKSVKVDLEKMQAKIPSVIPSTANLKDSQIVPIAFGLRKIVLSVIVDDAEGATEKVEAAIAKVQGVEEVSVERVTLL